MRLAHPAQRHVADHRSDLWKLNRQHQTIAFAHERGSLHASCQRFGDIRVILYLFIEIEHDVGTAANIHKSIEVRLPVGTKHQSPGPDRSCDADHAVWAVHSS